MRSARCDLGLAGDQTKMFFFQGTTYTKAGRRMLFERYTQVVSKSAILSQIQCLS